jgi:hypothetical protein
MTGLRALLLASVLGGLALTACGGAGSGGSSGPSSAAPAVGTNNPVPSATPSSDPYSGYGY